MPIYFEITPHPQTTDYDSLVTHDSKEALRFLQEAAESAWDLMELGQTLTVSIAMRDGDCGSADGCNVCQGAVAESKPKVVVVCGSMRFASQMLEEYQRRTLRREIVLIPGCLSPGVCDGHTAAEKELLDELHLRKIDLADEVLVLNIGGYMGESTTREVTYARSVGKPVRYVEEIPG